MQYEMLGLDGVNSGSDRDRRISGPAALLRCQSCLVALQPSTPQTGLGFNFGVRFCWRPFSVSLVSLKGFRVRV